MATPLYMDAEIRPNRSLSERGFIILIAIVTLANCISAAVFLAMGATFVPIFLGFDVLAVAVAFLVSFSAAQRIERVQVSAEEVRVTHETHRGLVEVPGQDRAVVVVAVRRQELHRPAEPRQGDRDVSGATARVLDGGPVGPLDDVDQGLADHQHACHALYPVLPAARHAHCRP